MISPHINNICKPKLQGFIETNLVEAAQAQKSGYDNQSRVTKFTKRDLVWFSNPTAGKLSPRWEGAWKIQEIKSPVTTNITNIATTPK